MRRDEYERSYGRRSHIPPPLPSPQEDPRSRRSRTKMKCLISIGLILPALAAVIGVAAWAVSADVVMNSGSNRGNSRVDNSLLQSYGIDNDNRPDIFRINSGENQRFQPRPRETSTTSTTTTTTTTTTSTTAAPVPQTLSPQEATDVNAIISKLISASGAASGGNGPRFVVVAPLPDTSEVHNSQSGISRADHSQSINNQPKESSRIEIVKHVEKPVEDLAFSASSHTAKLVAPPPPPKPNAEKSPASKTTDNRNSPSNKEVNRRMSGNVPNTHRSGFNSQPLELTGFEPFDTMIQGDLVASPSIHHVPPDPPPGYAVGTFKRGPPQRHFGSRNPHPSHHFDHKDQNIFNPRLPEHNANAFNPNHASSNHASLMMNPGIGLKPIQKQFHHVDSSAPLQTSESNRWGTIGLPNGGTYVHKPPEGISIGISSPSHSGTHVSSEPVSVIKSFFLPFLPKPRLNMNARVVFGVVLDKGMGLGEKKGAHHLG